MNDVFITIKKLRFWLSTPLLWICTSVTAAEQLPIHDIKTPAVDSSFELPALGWWLLAALLLTAVGLLIFVLWKNTQKQRIKRLAQRELAVIDCQHPDALKQINQIIKQVCLHYFPREFVAALSGEQWRLFLQTHQKKHATTNSEWFQLQYQPFDAQRHPEVSTSFKVFAKDFLAQNFPPKARFSPSQQNQQEKNNA